jgi:succinate dehydrogenase/fumarate reductase cytochrome b subunit
MKALIIIGGFFWLAFFVFHIFFWKLFDWKRDLESLTKINKAVMQVLNLCLMLVFLIFAYISIFHADELLTTGLGKSMLIGIVLFGIFRSIEQVIFFELRHDRSKAVLFVALLGTTIYLIPLISTF